MAEDVLDGCRGYTRLQRASMFAIRRREKLSERFQRLLRPGALLTGFFVTCTAIVQGLKAAAIPSAETWAPGSGWNWLLIVMVPALLLSLLVIWGYGRVLRRSGEDAELYRIARDTFYFVSEQLSVRRDVLGVNIWVVRGFTGARHLHRRVQFLTQERQPTSIVWCKGKGVIGYCWADNHPLVADNTAIAAQGGTKEAFCELPANERFGLSWEEFQQVQHYQAVLAVPIRCGPSGAPYVAGCVAIDVQEDGFAAPLETLGESRQLGALVRACGMVLEGGAR